MQMLNIIHLVVHYNLKVEHLNAIFFWPWGWKIDQMKMLTGLPGGNAEVSN